MLNNLYIKNKYLLIIQLKYLYLIKNKIKLNQKMFDIFYNIIIIRYPKILLFIIFSIFE